MMYVGLMERTKFRVLATAGAALFLLVLGILYETFRVPMPVDFDTKGFPTIGDSKAKVELIIFEDFRCTHCCYFSEEIYPELKKAYVDTGIASYTIVPLAFMNKSKPIGNAALAVYRQNPNRFFDYAHELFKACVDGMVPDENELYRIAKRVGGINLVRLQECIESHCYYEELENNLHLAKRLMGREFGTPTLYINGVSSPTSSFRAVQLKIQKALEKEGA